MLCPKDKTRRAQTAAWIWLYLHPNQCRNWSLGLYLTYTSGHCPWLRHLGANNKSEQSEQITSPCTLQNLSYCVTQQPRHSRKPVPLDFASWWAVRFFFFSSTLTWSFCLGPGSKPSVFTLAKSSHDCWRWHQHTYLLEGLSNLDECCQEVFLYQGQLFSMVFKFLGSPKVHTVSLLSLFWIFTLI